MSDPASVFQSNPEQLRLLVRAVNADRVVTNAALAAIAAVYFDYLITLPREIELMWNRKFTIPKVLYFFLKYWVMVHSVLWMTLNLDPKYTGGACNGPFDRNGSGIVSAHYSSSQKESAITEYTHFSGKNKWLGGSLLVMFLRGVNSWEEFDQAYAGVGFYFVLKFLGTVEFFDLPNEGLGCLASKGNGIPLFLAAIGLVVGLTISTSIMIGIGLRRRRAMMGPNKLFRIFYQDGIFYFLSLFILSVLNIAIFLVAPPGMQLLFVQPLVHFSAVLSTRMILHLRQWSAKQQIIVYSVNATTGERWIAQETVYSQDYRRTQTPSLDVSAYALRKLSSKQFS
ncbi:hypothetical protein FA13DRAFT_1789384 [Coprinellus micaceus]|uniref:DUF6533 domain-containing protein n=1 Tax=Coprinellus micaceus TaxID=71717 RepID=A0A4Y7TJU3_COPMI|nr:hypothetical protein FA13DRAFT_1789384 [Coprinellus micaceus]